MVRPVALLFDVFGTTVNWFEAVSDAISETATSNNITIDAASMAVAWRQAYFDGMAETVNGNAPWRKVDEIHRTALDRLLDQYDKGLVDESTREQLNQVWHRLDAWPDSIRGLEQIRARHIVATLSNANLDLLIDLNRHTGLQWDCLFCSDLFGHFKPDAETYLGACRYLGLDPQQVMMVACHRKDVEAAKRHGLLTAFVQRSDEYGHYRRARLSEILM